LGAIERSHPHSAELMHCFSAGARAQVEARPFFRLTRPRLRRHNPAARLMALRFIKIIDGLASFH
jgi:hypothetical protein